MTDPTPPPPLLLIERVLNELFAVSKAITETREQLDLQSALRDELIVRASELGATRRHVANVAGVTSGRVQQIIEAANPEPESTFAVTITEPPAPQPTEPGDVAAERRVSTIVRAADHNAAEALGVLAFKRSYGYTPTVYTTEIRDLLD